LAKNYDTRDLGNIYEVPVFYICGNKDWITPTVMAEDFFNTIIAPNKDFITIENAGHMMMMDQPKLFCEAVISVLANV
jgi:pimeloyl-ACP methyl ester carboxylesterase